MVVFHSRGNATLYMNGLLLLRYPIPIMSNNFTAFRALRKVSYTLKVCLKLVDSVGARGIVSGQWAFLAGDGLRTMIDLLKISQHHLVLPNSEEL